MSEKKGLLLLIEGHVQGVGFRWFTEKVASSLGLKGYVRNLPDGRVEAYAEGNEDILLKFLQRIHQGPGYGYVGTVEETWSEASGKYASFRITF